MLISLYAYKKLNVHNTTVLLVNKNEYRICCNSKGEYKTELIAHHPV